MRRFTSVLALSTALVAGASASTAWAQAVPAPRSLEISFQDGRVTLVATGVTLNEILAAWQRQGGTRIVNAERLTTGPQSYEFHNAPEAAVMQSLLRNAAGVIVAPRRPGGPVGASMLEQVLVLATSRPTTSAASVMTMPSTQNPNPVPIYGQPDDDIPPAIPLQRPASEQPARPPAPAPPSNQPSLGTAGSSSTPGVIVAPVKPGTPVPPGQIIK